SESGPRTDRTAYRDTARHLAARRRLLPGHRRRRAVVPGRGRSRPAALVADRRGLRRTRRVAGRVACCASYPQRRRHDRALHAGPDVTPPATFPTSGAYVGALQDTQRCFTAPELVGCVIRTDRFGLPRPISGNFASVFTADTTTGRRLAIKCFTRD